MNVLLATSLCKIYLLLRSQQCHWYGDQEYQIDKLFENVFVSQKSTQMLASKAG